MSVCECVSRNLIWPDNYYLTASAQYFAPSQFSDTDLNATPGVGTESAQEGDMAVDKSQFWYCISIGAQQMGEEVGKP